MFLVICLESSMERDRFMSPEEAKSFGLLDTILEHPPQLGDENKGETNDNTWRTLTSYYWYKYYLRCRIMGNTYTNNIPNYNYDYNR